MIWSINTRTDHWPAQHCNWYPLILLVAPHAPAPWPAIATVWSSLINITENIWRLCWERYLDIQSWRWGEWMLTFLEWIHVWKQWLSVYLHKSLCVPPPETNVNSVFVLFSVLFEATLYVFNASELITVISHSTFSQLLSTLFVYCCSSESIEVIAGIRRSALNGHDGITCYQNATF